MSTSSRFPTHHIPDDGTRYAPGEVVRLDHSSGQLQIILRKREATPSANTAPWTPSHPSRW